MHLIHWMRWLYISLAEDSMCIARSACPNLREPEWGTDTCLTTGTVASLASWRYAHTEDNPAGACSGICL